MKRCPRCKHDKSLGEFPIAKAKPDGRHTYCKLCCRDIMRQAYLRNPKKYLDKLKTEKLRLKNIADEVKTESGCRFCSEKTAVCLDFHHMNPAVKDDCINRILCRKNEQVLLDEIKKCIVICANCHRKLHAGLISWDISK